MVMLYSPQMYNVISCVCFRWYYIVVVPVTLASLRKWENPEDMDIHEVSRYLYLL